MPLFCSERPILEQAGAARARSLPIPYPIFKPNRRKERSSQANPALPSLTRRLFCRQTAFPRESVRNNCVEIVVERPPVERRVDARHVGNQRGRIARTPPRIFDGEVAAADAPRG